MHLRPIDVVVCYDPQGALISRKASRLDAFSAYHCQTRIPGGAPDGTTGQPEVCPPRSSRTSGGTAQDSNAHIEVPNHPVDMSSWGGSACYPRSTFYPLSDAVSTHVHRITMPWFPTCSACLPPSQAPLCHCTLNRPVANRPEGTFGSLRYAFGGDHPSQTARQTVSAQPRVRPQAQEGPYFNGGSTHTGVRASKPPAYPTHPATKVSAKLQ